MAIFPLFSCDWACWMVTSHNMAASHGNSGPSSGFFSFFSTLAWCDYMESEDKIQGEKVAKIWKEAWGQRDWLERWNHRKEQEMEAEEGRKRIRGRCPSWEKKIWWSWGAKITTQSLFSLKSCLEMDFDCHASLFWVLCSLSSCELIWLLIVSDTVLVSQRLLKSLERFKHLWLQPVEWE